MARIRLDGLRHSYMPNPTSDADWALKRLDLDWRDGGAYALLGPSGCGKSSLLNIVSGLVAPTEGRILFDDRDVTALAPDARAIAQVFQFPVVYDTMTVFENLAFPLKNRGVGREAIATRVREIAAMLELEDMLDRRAAGLAADAKQKISMGRGLVREDVNVIMFDEPLTVIDPHLKWKLRSKLKELHQRVRVTMIYVTHDQTEALTFADEVVVMQDGEIVQIGTPVELFERPAHTFVGHFIGSPGMNVLPCDYADGRASIEGVPIALAESAPPPPGERLEVGVRPEFVSLAPASRAGGPAVEGLPVEVTRVADAGRFRVIEARTSRGGHRLFALAAEGVEAPEGSARALFDPSRTRLYAGGRLVAGASAVTGGV